MDEPRRQLLHAARSVHRGDRIGGIQDQSADGVSGILLDDPSDHAEFAGAVCRLLDDPALARSIGERAHERVRRDFLGSRHLAQWLAICADVI